ncbi:MAG TPA: DinB family protein [Trueperaceae bacterium]|nr:DinB family protein [Trueperaceae bacterium]
MQTLKEHFGMLAKYNRVANARLLDACSGLPLGALEAQSSAPFGSIAGLLDHLLAADEVWLARFEGDLGAQLKKTPRQLLDLAAFRTRREALDARIEAFAASLTDDDLARPMAYRNSSGVAISGPLALLLAHMFNHQTHHRGQVQLLLRDAGVMGLVLDLHRLAAL